MFRPITERSRFQCPSLGRIFMFAFLFCCYIFIFCPKSIIYKYLAIPFCNVNSYSILIILQNLWPIISIYKDTDQAFLSNAPFFFHQWKNNSIHAHTCQVGRAERCCWGQRLPPWAAGCWSWRREAPLTPAPSVSYCLSPWTQKHRGLCYYIAH